MTHRLPARAAFWLQASMVLTFLAGSSAPTPLYALYRAEWGFSPITTTVVFGVYAVAVLAALLTVGSLSDHIGRRPVLLAATLTQVVVMGVFVEASSVGWLMVARVLQGLSTGAAVGALGAGLIDLNRTRGTVANAVAPMSGTATGGLLSGVLVQYLPDPTSLVYVVLGVAFVVQAMGVVLMHESVSRKAGALASLRPQFALPRAVRRPLLVAAPVLVAAWSLAGFYGSLGPILVGHVTGSRSFVLGGLALFVLAGSGGVTVLLTQNRPPRTVMALGTAALLIGVALTLVGINETLPSVFFLGAVVAGSGFGAGFQGGLRTVIPLAEAHERAGVLSTLFVISYLAMGVPAIIAGYLVVHVGGLVTTANEYAVAVMVLASLALLGLGSSRPARVEPLPVPALELAA